MYIEREDHLEGKVDICWGESASKCLHNTLNVSHFDTYVLSLRNSECLAFDNLEGAVEDVRKAVLCQWFTSVTENTQQTSPSINLT